MGLNSRTLTAKREAPALDYPKLMQHKDGYIVFFLREGEGMVVHGSSRLYPVGYMSQNWGTSNFEDYTTSKVVRLQNVKP
jgi:hypothetical protein